MFGGKENNVGKFTSPVISLFIFLIILIVVGRILNEINLSKCTTDKNIETAKKWASWAVGITSLGMIISLGVIIFFIVKSHYGAEAAGATIVTI